MKKLGIVSILLLGVLMMSVLSVSAVEEATGIVVVP